ncbi:EndoU domain-containing protein [Rhodococcus zopfii]|uniref:EndoU domain-containing protein n=1 Tax=Rhodococcus zopfii TaxID=43772 RepID=A0ABU3WTP6_9NOCA|nr:EndoU domain-containing protein [Rhodococcus zopfii]MDV2477391.1 EndoU domain-containing protein [Rhodococcus zopfii]MDV2477438.1 EndoU domain-containing protein [Rhodococcus zopfii]
MHAAEQRQRQDAIIVALVLALRRLIGSQGIPATDGQRRSLAQALLRPIQHARAQSYALAVAQMRQEAALAGVLAPTPAPLREYRHRAIVTLLEEATQTNVEIERDLDDDDEPAAVAPDDPPRRSRATVTIDELDDNSRSTARRILREPVTEENRRDPQVVDVVTRRITQAASRHAEMAGRHMLMDTVAQSGPLPPADTDIEPERPRSRATVTIDGDTDRTRSQPAVTITGDTEPERPRQVVSDDRQRPGATMRHSGSRSRDRSNNRRRPDGQPLDGAVLGWARILTGRESCGFCAMLASRGPVYRSEATASSTAGGRAFHRNCDCITRAIFQGRDWEGRAEYERLEQLWITSTIGHSGASARKAFNEAFAQARAQDGEQFVPASMRGDQAPDASRQLDADTGPGDDTPPPTDPPKRSAVADDDVPEPRPAEKWGAPRLEFGPLEWRHILDGEPDNPKLGGHRSGTGRENKTEFPPDWDDERIKAAVRLTEAEPQYVRVRGDRTIRRREVDGVIIEVSSYPIDGVETFNAAYPPNGDGVIRNKKGQKVPEPLDRSLLQLESGS